MKIISNKPKKTGKECCKFDCF